MKTNHWAQRIIIGAGILVVALSGVVAIEFALKKKEERVVTIRFVNSIDYASSKVDSVHRCAFIFIIENNLSSVALVGPFKLKIANATIKTGVSSISLEEGGKFELAVNGQDYVPCSEYRMKPWLESINCILFTGEVCNVVNVRSNDDL